MLDCARLTANLLSTFSGFSPNEERKLQQNGHCGFQVMGSMVWQSSLTVFQVMCPDNRG